MIIKRYCRYKGIMCSLATEFGYCQVTACINIEVKKNEFELKLTNLNANAVKCGFPCSSFDKYYLKLKNIDKEFKIVDSNTISDSTIYLQNREIKNLINEIVSIDIENLSVGEQFCLIRKK